LIADYRKLYFYKGLDGIFYLDTKPRWEKIVTFIKSKENPFDQRYSTFATHFFNTACDLKIDDHGRVVLSQRIMELLQVDKDGELIVQGMGEGLALWSKVEFDKRIENSEKEFETAAKELFANGFLNETIEKSTEVL